MIVNKTLTFVYNRDTKLHESVVTGRLLNYVGGAPPHIYALVDEDGSTHHLYLEKLGPGDVLTQLNYSDYRGNATGSAIFIREN